MRKKMILLIVLQVIVLSLLWMKFYAIDWTGEVVTLKTDPIDPIDIFYGEHVILNYDISLVDIKKLKTDKKLKAKDDLYVVLNKNDKENNVLGVYSEKPKLKSDEVVIKGRLRNELYDEIENISIEYDIEEYYVEQGMGKELEDKRGEFDVEVVVSPYGNKIKQLVFN